MTKALEEAVERGNLVLSEAEHLMYSYDSVIWMLDNGSAFEISDLRTLLSAVEEREKMREAVEVGRNLLLGHEGAQSMAGDAFKVLDAALPAE